MPINFFNEEELTVNYLTAIINEGLESGIEMDFDPEAHLQEL